ncbi:NUDIX domain-containing protein [Winogradskyella echinorum]|uniref:NUDIX domain-containing protein n=1 Tax=Winogradskyella echinorum TaxID=538189 RepID=A0ABR6Y589_9FLAO|nr:NUDIX domain-containing protein [Winogradskyella echinorum]MBC3847915.1 NUDIX domain-containing protein [Winogradskyella echinorum]MBC5752263.1 NUDIX domain-containing protein [Winogradskyella echinorum]
MDEYIDIVDKKGLPTGKTALKSEAHKNGWYHNTIHLWLYTSKGEILLQQRSHKKTIHPLLWDVSVAGHIDAGESFIDAAIRETKEEVGLQLDAQRLQKIGVFLHETNYGAIQDNEFHQVYIAELNVDFNQLHPQEEEVEALKLVSFTEFETLLNHSETNLHFIPSNKSYYSFVIKTIKEKLHL